MANYDFNICYWKPTQKITVYSG